MDGLGSAELARYLAGGITSARSPRSARRRRASPSTRWTRTGSSLAPLPNLLYHRDASCWIYGGVSVNAMNRPARMPETISDEAIYR